MNPRYLAPLTIAVALLLICMAYTLVTSLCRGSYLQGFHAGYKACYENMKGRVE